MKMMPSGARVREDMRDESCRTSEGSDTCNTRSIAEMVLSAEVDGQVLAIGDKEDYARVHVGSSLST